MYVHETHDTITYKGVKMKKAEEVGFSAKEHMWDRKIRFFMEQNCDEEGRILKDNMTRSERRVFFKLS